MLINVLKSLCIHQEQDNYSHCASVAYDMMLSLPQAHSAFGWMNGVGGVRARGKNDISYCIMLYR